jgi:hypothetical protein
MIVRTVNLMGQAAISPNVLAVRPEFDGGFDYCLDSPSLLPAGSTAHLFAHEDGTVYNIATHTFRERP